MKKMLALLLALAMLLGMAALAETAEAQKTAIISNITGATVAITSEGETRTVNLEDLGVSFVTDTSDGLRFVLTADKGEEILSFAVAELAGNKVRVGLMGSDRTFEAEIPNTPVIDTDTLVTSLRDSLPQLINYRIPEIRVAALPKLDLASLFGGESTEVDGVTTTAVDIPAESVSMMIQMAASIVKASADSIPQGEQVVAALDQFVESGFSFAIKGTISDNGPEQAANIGIYLASDGETASDPTLFLNTTSAENSFVLAVDLPSDDTSYTIGQLTVATDPAAQTIDCGLDFAGMASIAMNIYQQESLQCVDLSCSLPGYALASSLNYGEQEGQEYYAFNTKMGDDLSFQITIAGEEIEDGDTGTMNVSVASNGSSFDFSGTFYDFLANFDMAAVLDGYELPSETASFEDITEDEINAVVNPVMEALNAVLGAEEPAA